MNPLAQALCCFVAGFLCVTVASYFFGSKKSNPPPWSPLISAEHSEGIGRQIAIIRSDGTWEITKDATEKELHWALEQNLMIRAGELKAQRDQANAQNKHNEAVYGTWNTSSFIYYGKEPIPSGYSTSPK